MTKPLITALLLFPVLMLGQEICGVVEEDEQAEVQYLPYSTIYHKEIKAVCHVYTSSFAPWSNIYPLDIDSAFSSLNYWFEEADISFELVSVQYHSFDSVAGGLGCLPSTTAALNAFSAVHWDRERYMNVYIVPSMCGSILGFAFRGPTQYSTADGVWVLSNAFGFTNPYMFEDYDQNKTLIHEVGHYCGLYHVFHATQICNAGVSSDCSQIQDRVCDTPPTTVNRSCEEPDCSSEALWEGYPWEGYQHNNHMDYYVDSCRTSFTDGQIDRMHSWLSSVRSTLFEDYSCLADINDDGVVGTNDMLAILSNFGEVYEPADLDFDGVVGNGDILVLLSEYGDYCQ